MVVEGTQTEGGGAAAPETTSTPAGSTEGAPKASPEAPAGDAGQGGAAVVPPPYQPNLTFKVRQQEKKFDEWIAPHIKDAETEKKARELHERAYGIDFVKQERANLQREHQTLKQTVQTQYQPVMETAQQIVHFRDQGNLPAVFNLLGVKSEDVFKWAYAFAQKSPEARQLEEHHARNGMEAYGAQHQMSQAQSQAVQQAADFKTREFALLTQYNPQVSSVMTEFDQQHGQNAFFEQVKRTGIYYHSQGKDISVEDAVNEVIKLFGRGPQSPALANPGQGAPGMVQQPQGNMVSTPQAPTPKPVIPGIQGKGTSPAKRVITSFADARQRSKELSEAAD